jgi:arginyl-tRNA synthetase
VGFTKYGKEEELQKNAIRHLFDVYVKINKEAKENESLHEAARAYFKKMEDGDPEALGLWKRFRSLSIEEYKKIYAYIQFIS